MTLHLYTLHIDQGTTTKQYNEWLTGVKKRDRRAAQLAGAAMLATVATTAFVIFHAVPL